MPSGSRRSFLPRFSTSRIRGRNVRFLAFWVLPLAAVAALGAAIGWLCRTRPLGTGPRSGFSGRTLTIQLGLNNVDPLTDGGTVTLTWEIKHDSCNPFLNASSLVDPSLCATVNIFMDTNRFANPVNPGTTLNNSRPGQPIFQYNPGWHEYLGNIPTFRTDLAMWAPIYTLSDSILNYPFDDYLTEIFMYAQEDNTTVPVGLRVRHQYGFAFGFDAKFLEPSEVPHYTGVGEEDYISNLATYGALDLLLYVRRTVLVRAYVIIIVVAMWLITLLFLAIAFKAAFLGYRIDVAILAAPVATLFAFTTLRSAMPGSPSAFGAIIDFVGTLPALAVLIIITILTLFHVFRSAERVLMKGIGMPPAHVPYNVTRSKDDEGHYV